MALIQNYLNNAFVNGSGKTVTVNNPWTDEALHEVSEAGALDFIKSLKSAKEAQEKYKKFSLEQRADILVKLAELINENKQTLAKAESRDEGLPEKFCLEEIVDAAQKYIENLNLDVRLFPRPESISPTGVLGISGPRSMAFLFQAKWIASALAAGCGVILKSCRELPGSAHRLAEILQKLNLPEGLIQVLHGADEELNPLIAGHPGLAGFLYSGNFQGSENLILESAKRKKKVQFYLGAKNSAIIHPDFDFKSNMDQILAPALTGAGQLDFNTHRFFVSQNVEKDFYEAVQNHMDKIKCTPILNQNRKEQFMKAVERVIPEEGKVLTRGVPTFTKDLPNCSDLQQDQVVGPLFLITAVKYVHEMAKWTNTGYLGHSAIIWGPEDKARNLANQLNVGQVMINKWSGFSDWALPVKQSFWGTPDAKWSGAFYSDVKKLDLR